jgi:hypothetical protein
MERVDVGRACVRQVEGSDRAGQTQPPMQQACIGRQDVIRRLCAENERVDLLRQAWTRGKQRATGLLAQIESGLSGGRNMTMPNAGEAHEQRAFEVVEAGGEFRSGLSLLSGMLRRITILRIMTSPEASRMNCTQPKVVARSTIAAQSIL